MEFLIEKLINTLYSAFKNYSRLASFKQPYSMQDKKRKHTGSVLVVSCVRLSHAITCLFPMFFQFLYIFIQIFKYFALFQYFFALFLKNRTHALTFYNRSRVSKKNPTILIRKWLKWKLSVPPASWQISLCNGHQTNPVHRVINHNSRLMKPTWKITKYCHHQANAPYELEGVT